LKPFTVIAHRGASGYLPEHTLESVTMAHAMGVDYIEQDVVLTRDRQLIVLHDLHLDNVSDVAARFPGRQREDGLHYAIDFTLAEIQTLHVHERTGSDGKAAFPGRFPHCDALFRIPTLDQEITLIKGLNSSTGRNTGLYIEPKSPAWHTREGCDLLTALLTCLSNHGYRGRQDKVYLQSFDMELLQRARFDLAIDLKLVQLIGENSWQESDSDFDFLQTAEGLDAVAKYADGIGPWLMQLVHLQADGNMGVSGLAGLAQQRGLFVHGYTLRADQLPSEIDGMQQAVDLLLRAGLDGVFTDHPDQVIR
jgi:glycerophosphoryl diester phosphodiesterase